MKVANIITSTGFRIKNNKALGIQNYDYDNAYPQKVDDIVRSSGTGLSCVRIFARFLFGNGFSDENTANAVINNNGETLNDVLRKVRFDFAMFNGFALHVNYNMLYEVSEIQHIPFEHCRFEAKCKDTGEYNRVAVYDDWTHRDTDRKAVKKQDIDFLDIFNPNKNYVKESVELCRCAEDLTGWKTYKGQVLYYSGSGEKVYPAPIFEAVLTNMRTEEGVDNVVARNVACNFLPGVVLVDINNSPESAEQFDKLKKDISEFQGDENAGNVMLIQVNSREEIPESLNLHSQNFDKEFSVTQQYVPDAIGRAFSQPPILRAEDVNTGFSTSEMVNAYRFYNTQTEDYRAEISRVFEKVLKHYKGGIYVKSTYIEPLSYNVGSSYIDTLGREITTDIVNIIKDTTLNSNQKINILSNIYGFPKLEAIKYIL